MMRKMSEEELKKLMEDTNGIFPEKNKIDVDSIIGMVLTIEDYKLIIPSTGERYFAVTFEELPDSFILSGKALSGILCRPFEMKGLQIRHKEPVETSTGKTFRPVEVIGYKN